MSILSCVFRGGFSRPIEIKSVKRNGMMRTIDGNSCGIVPQDRRSWDKIVKKARLGSDGGQEWLGLLSFKIKKRKDVEGRWSLSEDHRVRGKQGRA